MQTLRNEAEPDFLTRLVGERERLVQTREAFLLTTNGLLKPDAVSGLSQALVKAMELIKSAEDRIQESERILEQTRADRSRYQFLFDRAPTALLVTSSDTTIRSANRAASHMLGREISQLVGRDITGMVHIDHLRVFREHLARLVTSGEANRWTVCLRPMGKSPPFFATIGVRMIHDPMTTHHNLYWSLTAN